jgi:hypothetical protein
MSLRFFVCFCFLFSFSFSFCSVLFVYGSPSYLEHVYGTDGCLASGIYHDDVSQVTYVLCRDSGIHRVKGYQNQNILNHTYCQAPTSILKDRSQQYRYILTCGTSGIVAFDDYMDVNNTVNMQTLLTEEQCGLFQNVFVSDFYPGSFYMFCCK